MRVATFGEALGSIRGDGVGGLDQLHSAHVSVGGAELNVAIALARLGVDARWLGRVGDDPLGRRIARELRAERVDGRVIIDSGRTALMLKEQLPFGRTRVTFYRDDSAGSRLVTSDVDRLDIAEVDLMHLTGIVAGLSAGAEAAVRRAVGTALAAGVPLSFDVNHRPTVWGDRDAAAVYREIAASSSIVFGGREEFQLLVGVHRDDRALAEAVAALGAKEVVLKRGHEGAAALVDGSWAEQDAIPVDVVDSVGAGDLFVAGYLSAALARVGVAGRLAAAVVNGAAACAHPGDWEGAQSELSVPTLDPVIR